MEAAYRDLVIINGKTPCSNYVRVKMVFYYGLFGLLMVKMSLNFLIFIES
jgi:hypothetical protein